MAHYGMQYSPCYDIERFIKNNCLDVNEKFNCITSIGTLPSNPKVNINMQIVNSFVFGMGAVSAVGLFVILVSF